MTGYRLIENKEGKGNKWEKTELGNLEQVFLYSNLLMFMHEYLKKIHFTEKTFLVFSEKEEKLLDKIASDFLTPNGDRPAVFLDSLLLTNLRKMYAIGFSATYISEDPNISITEAKEGQLRLAISIM